MHLENGIDKDAYESKYAKLMENFEQLAREYQRLQKSLVEKKI